MRGGETSDRGEGGAGSPPPPPPPPHCQIESTVAEYSNFRYYSELLGADILAPPLAVALMDFRESHTGSVAGITRWSDHLDDMPALWYLASALWYDRMPSFWSLHYGHMANCASIEEGGGGRRLRATPPSFLPPIVRRGARHLHSDGAAAHLRRLGRLLAVREGEEEDVSCACRQEAERMAWADDDPS